MITAVAVAILMFVAQHLYFRRRVGILEAQGDSLRERIISREADAKIEKLKADVETSQAKGKPAEDEYEAFARTHPDLVGTDKG